MGNGFRIVEFKEMKRMKVSTMDPRPKVVFVNRRKAFQPPDDTLAKYKDLTRREKSDPGHIDPLRGDVYKNRYGLKIIRSNEAMGQLRRLAEESREKEILLVIDKDRPDAKILLDLIEHMMVGGAW